MATALFKNTVHLAAVVTMQCSFQPRLADYGIESFASTMMKLEMKKMDIPDRSEFLSLLKDSFVKLQACKLAMNMFHYAKQDMLEDEDGVLTVVIFTREHVEKKPLFYLLNAPFSFRNRDR